MKAISLWQPWASAIAVGAKCIETRSWATSYRGPLAIHAALTTRGFDVCQLLWSAVFGLDHDEDLGDLLVMLPRGAIVATATLKYCVRAEDVPEEELRRRRGAMPGFSEMDLGDFTRGRWAWVLTDVQRLAKPIPWRGRQGLFDVPDDVIAAAAAGRARA